MTEFAALPGRTKLESLLTEALAGTDATIVSMELEHIAARRPPYRLVVLIDAVDGHGFTFNHGMPDLDHLPLDVSALAKVIREHLEERNGNPTTATIVH